MQTIKQNPGPAALTALGASWLFMNGRSSGTQSKTAQSSSGSGLAGVGESVQSSAGQAQDMAGDITHQVQDGIGTAADQVGHAATEVAGGVAHGAGTVVEGAVQGTGAVVEGVAHGGEAVVGGVAHSATSIATGVQSTVTNASSQVKQMPSRLRHMVEENPVRLGLVAAALGSVAALAVPETQRENELLGEARDSVIERAQSTAQSTMQKVQHVAEEAGETLKKEAKYAGLSKDDK